MPVVLIEGFDSMPAAVTDPGGMQAAWTLGSTSNWTFPAGRFGGQAAANAASGAVTFERGLPAAISALAVGFAFRAAAGGAPASLIAILSLRSSATGHQIGLAINTNGQLVVWRTTTANVIATADISTVPDWASWHYLEIEAVIHASAGEVRAYIDGAEVINESGLDTTGQADAVVDVVRWQFCGNTWGASDTEEFDDLYVVDAATRLGDSRVITLHPAAESGTPDWTPSTGTDNAAMVDDAAIDGDTTYVESDTAGHIDLYTVGTLGVTPATVHAVQVSAVMRKTDAGERTGRTKLSSNATVSNGATEALSSSYGWHRTIHGTDPATAAAWLPAAVEACLIGQEVIS